MCALTAGEGESGFVAYSPSDGTGDIRLILLEHREAGGSDETAQRDRRLRHRRPTGQLGRWSRTAAATSEITVEIGFGCTHLLGEMQMMHHRLQAVAFLLQLQFQLRHHLHLHPCLRCRPIIQCVFGVEMP